MFGISGVISSATATPEYIHLKWYGVYLGVGLCPHHPVKEIFTRQGAFFLRDGEGNDLQQWDSGAIMQAHVVSWISALAVS